MAIIKFNYQSPIRLAGVAILKNFLVEMAKNEGRIIGRLDYVFCTDDYLLELNKGFLNHDTLTDIITFDLAEADLIVGEIYISIERVNENARTFRTSKIEEFRRVIFHGLLHLLGYGDKTKREITIMRQKEDEYLRLFEQKINA